mmetsp:Transcript_112946/g.315582  ORF Transcript_112946/g.315582 Transcript_112946/m.315582 type:complete len:286 (+) Transcript_112946:480-1337(+)
MTVGFALWAFCQPARRSCASLWAPQRPWSLSIEARVYSEGFTPRARSWPKSSLPRSRFPACLQPSSKCVMITSSAWCPTSFMSSNNCKARSRSCRSMRVLINMEYVTMSGRSPPPFFILSYNSSALPTQSARTRPLMSDLMKGLLVASMELLRLASKSTMAAAALLARSSTMQASRSVQKVMSSGSMPFATMSLAHSAQRCGRPACAKPLMMVLYETTSTILASGRSTACAFCRQFSPRSGWRAFTQVRSSKLSMSVVAEGPSFVKVASAESTSFSATYVRKNKM